ncbi:MAG: hypothetical protein C0613_08920 [Desulfobulbaceae bacterium]|nr:MAG: hypothetical protein C0613_08920 [Desulfobulbaceae bacterium]
MRNDVATILLLTVVVWLLAHAQPVQAHKVHIFAYADGEQIRTESRFSGDRPARNCEVTVQAPADQEIMVAGSTDAQGLFAFAKPKQGGDLDIIVSCGDGHRGSWRLEAADYLDDRPEAHEHLHQESRQPASPSAAIDEARLRGIVADEVEKKLAPLRRDLARLAERKTTPQDIVGGIGYFLGLAGLAAYFRYRKGR